MIRKWFAIASVCLLATGCVAATVTPSAAEIPGTPSPRLSSRSVTDLAATPAVSSTPTAGATDTPSATSAPTTESLATTPAPTAPPAATNRPAPTTAPPLAPSRVTAFTTTSTFTTVVRWVYPSYPRVTRFTVYAAIINPCFQYCEPPPCAKPPFGTVPAGTGLWTLARSVGPTVRSFSFTDAGEGSLLRACGVWVVATNSAGSSASVLAAWTAY
jgi:hypothetical protein